MDIHAIFESLPLAELRRIDGALEGNWNATVTTVWSPEDKTIDFSKMVKSHPTFKPSLELYFDGAWMGVHCFKRVDEQNVFDEELARKIINQILSFEA